MLCVAINKYETIIVDVEQNDEFAKFVNATLINAHRSHVTHVV